MPSSPQEEGMRRSYLFLASLIILAMPMITQPLKRDSTKSFALAPVALADHGRPILCPTCPCDPAVEDCSVAAKLNSSSSPKRVAAPYAHPRSVLETARAIFFVFSVLALN